MRLRAKKDRNHREIVKALRNIGATVADVSSVPCGFDIVVGYRGVNFVIEIKDGEKFPSQRKLTNKEETVKTEWRGKYFVVETIDEAINILCGI